MIRNEQDFSASLDKAERLLEDQPAVDAPEHIELMALMRKIMDFRPTVMEPAPGLLGDERARLAQRLAAFEERVIPHYEDHWEPMVGLDAKPH